MTRWLAQIHPTVCNTELDPITVQVIDHNAHDGRANAQSYRLFATILLPAAGATELAAAAHSERGHLSSPSASSGPTEADPVWCCRLNPPS